MLMWAGAMPAEEPYASIALIASAYWFAYFLVVLPLLGVFERPHGRPRHDRGGLPHPLQRCGAACPKGKPPRRPDRDPGGVRRHDPTHLILAAGARGLPARAAPPCPCRRARRGTSPTTPSPLRGRSGSYDQMQLQRGLQVYTEICSLVPWAQIRAPCGRWAMPGGPELPEEQVIAYSEFSTRSSTPRSTTTAPPSRRTTIPESQFEGAPDLSLIAKGARGLPRAIRPRG